MTSIKPRDRARALQPLIGIRSIEKMLLRHTITHTPEIRVVVAVICNAMVDCAVGTPHERADAEAFMRDWRLGVWADAVGLNPDFVREVATKAQYLRPATEPVAQRGGMAASSQDAAPQNNYKETLHA